MAIIFLLEWDLDNLQSAEVGIRVGFRNNFSGRNGTQYHPSIPTLFYARDKNKFNTEAAGANVRVNVHLR